MKIYWVYVY
nr:unnamed protein product [Callosobruchus chinensis]